MARHIKPGRWQKQSSVQTATTKPKREKAKKPILDSEGRLAVCIIPKEGTIRDRLLEELKRRKDVFVLVSKPHKAAVTLHDDHATLMTVKPGPNEIHILVREDGDEEVGLKGNLQKVKQRRLSDTITMMTQGAEGFLQAA